MDLDILFEPLRSASAEVDVRAEVFRRLRAGSFDERPRRAQPLPGSRQFLPAVAIPAMLGAFALVKLSTPILGSPRAWGVAAAGCARATLLFAGALLETVRPVGEGLATAALRTVAAIPGPPGSVSFTTATAAAVTALAGLTIITCVAAARDLRFRSFERSSPR